MLQQKAPVLTTVLSEVLANLAFMFTDDESAEPSPGDVWLETTISYRGPAQGTLKFRCPKDFSHLLAANLLGVDPQNENAESKGEDAAREFMNILCGQLITSLHGAEEVFDLSIPQSNEMSEMPDLSVEEGPESVTMSVEGYRVQLAYLPSAEEPAAP